MANNFNDRLNLSEVIGTVFDSVSVRPLRPFYVFDASCKEKVWDLSSQPKKGDTMTFVLLSAQTANTGALQSTVTTLVGSKKLVYSRRSVSLSLYGDHMCYDTLEAGNESFVDDLSDLGFSMADQAMNSLDVLARNAMDLNRFRNETSGTLSNTAHYYGSYGNLAGTAGPMKAKTVRAVVAQLRGANVMPFADGLYRCIMHPTVYTQLRADSDNAGWTPTNQYVDQSELLVGDMGVFEGVRFIMNSNVKGAGTNTLSAYIFGREFVGKAIGQDVRVATKSYMEGPHENILTMFWDALIGYKVIRVNAGVVVETTAVAK